jgi:tetratricopeptide (TPR) repeat protein
MSNNASRVALLVPLYQRFLDDQDSAVFAKSAAKRYTAATLERIATCGDRLARRAAVLALGYLGEYDSNPVLGRALVDRDRGVRTLAESAIRNLWCRVGTPQQRKRLRAVARYNEKKQFQKAAELATRLIHDSPWVAEAWCQRGTAYYHLGQHDDAIRDCHQALEINPYHFTAAAGMGQCYLKQNNAVAALEAFRRALRLNPSMEEVRAQVIRLQKSLNNGK